ncbi:MAG: hypothetical protein ABI406_02325 [Ktedonobacteraceae bacterium]
MKEQAQQLSSDELNSLFAQLNPLDVEQFYTAYQLWNTQQRMQTLQALIDAIQRDIVENTEHLEQVHPSPLALATLACLQSNGVSDVAILDHMLERGEEWLDRTMQRLEYCEKLDVISGDYTKWCEHALEGAYDWIDSMLRQEAVDTSSIKPTFSETTVRGYQGPAAQAAAHENSEGMEELFFQKLMSDDLENEEEAELDASLLETTLKVGALPQPAKQETVPDTSNTQPTQPALNMLPVEQDRQPEAVEATPVLAETEAGHTDVKMMVVEEPQDVLSPTRTTVINYGHTPDRVAALPPPVTSTRQKRGFLRTLIAVLFHV